MRVRALGRAAIAEICGRPPHTRRSCRLLVAGSAIALLLGCAPSEELASYSQGWPPSLEAGNGSISATAAPEGANAVPTVVTGSAGADDDEAPAVGGSETGMTPEMVAGGSESAPPNESPPPIAGVNSSSAQGSDVPAGGAGAGAGSEVEEPAVAEPAGPAEFRFVRFVADSDFSGGPLTSVAELNVLDAEGAPLDRYAWVAAADSEETLFVGGAPASLAIDGAPASIWHTAWFQVTPPPHPHTLEIDMGAAHAVGGFRYLARQDGSVDGRVAQFRFYVSLDGIEWGEPAAQGTLENVDTEQDVAIGP
jgi:F5/8 type C domain